MILERLKIFSFLILGLSSCVVNKPDSSSVGSFDYNGRCTVENPIYRKQLSAVGYGSICASTLGGGYLGYSSNLISYYQNGEKKSAKIGNALIGAAVGYSISFLGNRLMGWGKTSNNFTGNEWLKKANGNYKSLAVNFGQIKAIDKKYEPIFTFRTIEDIRDFKMVFPNSNLVDNKIIDAIQNKRLNRTGYQNLLEQYPNSTNTVDIKKSIIENSVNLSELYEAWDKYKINLNYEKLSFDLVNYSSDFVKFVGKFPNTSYSWELFEKCKIWSLDDVEKWLTYFPNHVKISEARLYFISKSWKYDINRFYKLNEKYNVIKFSDVFDDNYSNNVDKTKKMYDRLESSKNVLGIEFTNKLVSELKNDFLKARNVSAENSSKQLKDFLSLLQKNAWLYPEAQSYELFGKANLTIAQTREEETRKKAEEDRKAKLQEDLKKACANNDKAEIERTLSEGALLEPLKFEEMLKVAINFPTQANKDILYSKYGYWTEGEALLKAFPEYYDILENRSYVNLQDRAEKKDWCYTCCETYLKLYTKNSDRIRNVEEWRRFAHDFDVAETNRKAAEEQRKAAEAKAKVSTSSTSTSSSYSSSNNSQSPKYDVLVGTAYCRVETKPYRYVSIYVRDGGIFSSNVCAETYSLVYTTSQGKVEEKDDPFKDDFDAGGDEDDLPITVEIIYDPSSSCKGEKTHHIIVRITAVGEYTIYIDQK